MVIRPVDTAEEAVEQGARLLDEHRPGWENTISDAIEAGEFDMSCWNHCVVGTLELFDPDEWWADRKACRVRVGDLDFDASGRESSWVGFTRLPGSDDDALFALEYMWRQQVRRRVDAMVPA